MAKRYTVNVRHGNCYVVCGIRVAGRDDCKETAEFICNQLNSAPKHLGSLDAAGKWTGLESPMRPGWEAVVEEIEVSAEDLQEEIDGLKYNLEQAFPEFEAAVE